jgi:hypothetical protein
MVFLNQDGCALMDGWYLRVAGEAAKYPNKREFPSK